MTIPFFFRTWLDTLRGRRRGGSVPAPRKRSRRYSRPLLLETLETRLNPSVTSGSLTSSPFAASYAPAAAVAATNYLYVDQNNPTASDTGPGSETHPFLHIQAAADRAVAGTAVVVKPGTYNEKVTVKNSGTADAPVVFTVAPGAGVTVTGQSNGFLISGKSYVTVSGFTITRTSTYGINVSNSSHITIEGNDVSYSGQPALGATSKGIYFNQTTDSTIWQNRAHHNTDSGIYLVNGSTGVTVAGNEAFANARGYERAAPGIEVRSSGNTVYGNVAHDNEDSGIQLYAGAANNLVSNNVIYNNGDHGIDVNGSTGNRLIANSVYKSVTAGINVEGTSTGTTIANNISVDNGINSTRTKSNIRVDAASQSGTTLDYDLVFLSTPGQLQITWGSTSYSSLASFRAATGQELHGGEADPLWVDPSVGNLHLRASSPAIDSANANASGQPDTDADGNTRVDDPSTPNFGAGTPPYADRGAYEFQPTNRPPQAVNLVATTAQDTPTSITLAATDPDGDLLTYAILTPPSHGTLSVVSGSGVTYTPDPGYTGPDGFTYKANDGQADSDAATVSIMVTSANNAAPVAQSQSVTTNEDAATPPITLGANDADGDPLTYTIVSGPSHGTLSGSGATRIYTPAPNYNGPDNFTFKVNDGQADSNTVTVRIAVTPVNDAPVAVNGSATATEDGRVSGRVSATDVDSATLTYSVVQGPQHGTLTLNSDGTYTYTPAPNYYGADTFTFQASDESLASNVATMSLTVTGVPDAPVANADTAKVKKDSFVLIDVLANDTDPDNLSAPLNAGLSIKSFTQGGNGTVTLVNGQLKYTPRAGSFGDDSFTYTIIDSQGNTATATVTVKMIGPK